MELYDLVPSDGAPVASAPHREAWLTQAFQAEESYQQELLE